MPYPPPTESRDADDAHKTRKDHSVSACMENCGNEHVSERRPHTHFYLAALDWVVMHHDGRWHLKSREAIGYTLGPDDPLHPYRRSPCR